MLNQEFVVASSVANRSRFVRFTSIACVIWEARLRSPENPIAYGPYEDQESAGRGMRVGLSLKGVDAKDLDKTSWLDDGSFKLAEKVTFAFAKSAYYKQELDGRDLHLQLPGELVLASIVKEGDIYSAKVPGPVPVWEGMRLAVIDLNGKSLRVAGGGLAKVAP